ncbi:MAG: tRNA 2-thiocytidine biosynthesis protein TtcA, partial [Desulfovibrionaceae bacterium]|nr:tRNA 2-thiocytidine biosynthesis protein TtcA [Desulfovibrionaceae bacterium]
WLDQAGLAYHLELTDYGVLAHSPENLSKSPCFRCAWLRRKRLFTLVEQYHLTHLALGHTANDLATTFFLNLCNNGRVQGLSVKESFFKGALLLIRPLLLLKKKTIQTAARQWNLPIVTNLCPSANLTKRKAMQDLIQNFTKVTKQARTSLFNALTTWQLEQDLALKAKKQENL